MWFVMQVYMGTEQEVCQQCRRVMSEEEDAFIFQAERMTKVHGQWTLTMSRLFPGYVFVKTRRIEELFVYLKRTGAMTKVLRTGEDITPVYAEEEEYLRLLGGDDHIVKYSEGYMEGEKLTVISGAMKNYRGIVKRILRHRRLVVLEVPIMGRTVEVTVGLGVVKRQ